MSDNDFEPGIRVQEVHAGTTLCLGLIWVGLDTYKQGWHDKLAHTYVLRQHRF